MIIDFNTRKELPISKQIRSIDIDLFTKEVRKWVFNGYSIKILNTSLKVTRFGNRQSFFAELVQND